SSRKIRPYRRSFFVNQLGSQKQKKASAVELLAFGWRSRFSPARPQAFFYRLLAPKETPYGAW
ncbi:hypothetical protein, partial [Hymenobacter sediminis]|uniref:hypothetical protein n=1 Tax=Hymenobacter sediminis TaxID=2218621 RepID=UPI001EE4834B